MFVPNHLNFRSVLIILLVAVAIESGEANWVQQTEVPTSRNGVATAVVNGKIYIIGGVPYSNKSGPGWSALPTIEVYDTRIGAWGKAADMPTPRIAAQAAVFAREIYVFGGYSRERSVERKTIKPLKFTTREPIHGQERETCQRFVVGLEQPLLMEKYTSSVARFSIDNAMSESLLTSLKPMIH